MTKKLSTEEYIEKASKIHNNAYDYSLARYNGQNEKVKIICSIHGEFSISANKHYKGYGCKICDNTKKFIQKSTEKHGDRYDYSKSEYIDSKTKVKIICSVHGEFLQLPSKHYIGQGCSDCSKKIRKVKECTSKDFIKKARNKHGDKYDYSLTNYVNSKTKIKIICKKQCHGVFEQDPSNHLMGRGCPKCGNELKNKNNTKNIERFIIDATDVHKNKYDYSKTNYINNKTKIEIICHKHGSFFQEPRGHINNKSGCPNCKIELLSNKFRLSNDEFIKRSIKIHNSKYSYLKSKYINDDTKVIITCPVHGDFKQRGGGHLQGKGCRKCANEVISKINKKNTKYFIEKSNSIHNFKYDYSIAEYDGSCKKVKIICPKHGIFYQEPSNHYGGKGCPKCSHHISTGEDEIAKWLESLNIKVIKNTRKIISPKEIDIYLPEYNLGIEYNGIYWHSEKWGKNKNYHKQKTELSRENGIHLMQFWDSEWDLKKDIVKSIILNKLGIWEKRYFARKLELKSIQTKDSRIFCEENHIHGFRGGVKHNGLYNDTELIALMITASDGEMVRFVIKNNYTVIGGFSKLLKYSDVKYSFVDQRIFNGHGYLKNGFKLMYTTSPNYFYTKGRKMETRIKYQKHKLGGVLENFDKNLSEVENMKNNGFYKIFDCGHFKMVRTK